MAGTNFIGNAYQQLSQLLGTPIPGRDSSGFDALSNQYSGTTQSGMADITRRGLSQSGAVPQLFESAGEQYASGAGNVVASGQQQQNQQTQQILAAMLGLTGAQEGRARYDTASRLSDYGAGADALIGLFGDRPGTLFSGPATGFLSSGIYGNPKSLFSRLLGLVP